MSENDVTEEQKDQIADQKIEEAVAKYTKYESFDAMPKDMQKEIKKKSKNVLNQVL